MSAAERARAALDALAEPTARTEAEWSLRRYLHAWSVSGKPDVIAADPRGCRLRASDLRAVLELVDELRASGARLPSSLPAARRGDPSTSKRAAASPARQRRAGSQALRLLEAYRRIADYRVTDDRTDPHPAEYGLTDSEARAIAGISARSCYWKRCSELRAEGLIRPVLEPSPASSTVLVTAPGEYGERLVARVAAGSRDVTRTDADTGEERIVCRITVAGRAELARFHP